MHTKYCIYEPFLHTHYYMHMNRITLYKFSSQVQVLFKFTFPTGKWRGKEPKRENTAARVLHGASESSQRKEEKQEERKTIK